MKDKENIDMYKKGVSKESLVKLVFYNEKKEKNITKHEAIQGVGMNCWHCVYSKVIDGRICCGKGEVILLKREQAEKGCENYQDIFEGQEDWD